MKQEAVLEALRSGEKCRQLQALVELDSLTDSTLIDAVIPCLESEDVDLRGGAVCAVAKAVPSSGPLFAAKLIPLLQDLEDTIRSDALDTIAVLRIWAAVPSMCGLLRDDPNATVRATAAEALAAFPSPVVSSALSESLDDQDHAVRAYAAMSLGLMGSPTVKTKLERVLEGETDYRVRAEILGALGRLGRMEGFGEILDYLATSEEDLACSILNCLEDILTREPKVQLGPMSGKVSRLLCELEGRFPLLARQAEDIRLALHGPGQEAREEGDDGA